MVTFPVMDDIGECYELSGGSRRKGYVRVEYKYRTHSAHRIAWMAVNGPIPEKGEILHRCDNRSCIRASHLYLGTNEENVRDRVMRLRSWHKLTDEEVLEIRAKYSAWGRGGMTGRQLAAQYGVSKAQISRIVTGQRRKDIGAG